MTSTNEDADRVWASTLQQIRKTRRQRGLGRITLAVVSACALGGVSWFLLNPPLTIPMQTAVTEPGLKIEETIAVMRVGEDGIARLEELSTGRLRSIELTFGLTQVVCEDLTDLAEQTADAGQVDAILFQQIISSRWAGSP